MKGCSILAESGRDQPWGGNAPPQAQPTEGCVDIPVPWEAESCLHLDGKQQGQAGSRVLQTLTTNIWVPLGRNQHRDEAHGEPLWRRWEVQDLLLHT